MTQALPYSPAKLKSTALKALCIALGAFGAGFAAVPLYRYFCQTTGFGGTTHRVESMAGITPVPGKTMSVRFDSNVSPGMPWQFYPEQRTQTIEVMPHDIGVIDEHALGNLESQRAGQDAALA